MYVYIYTHIYIHIHRPTHTHTYMYVCIRTHTSHDSFTHVTSMSPSKMSHDSLCSYIRCLISWITFCKLAINCRALLRKMTYKDKASYSSSPPCTQESCRQLAPSNENKILVSSLKWQVSFAGYCLFYRALLHFIC